MNVKLWQRRLILASEFIFMLTFIYTGFCWVFVRNIEMEILLFTALLGEMLVLEIQLDMYKPSRHRKLNDG